MKSYPFISLFGSALLIATATFSSAAEYEEDFSPMPWEQQLPEAMHSEMKDLPHITVGMEDVDLIGSDNRVLQAAVDYIAGLGGGVVEIGAGRYTMRDSLHLRSNITIRGIKGKTVLHKADAVESLLALDGDFGEQRGLPWKIRMASKSAAVSQSWTTMPGGFHTTVARITGPQRQYFFYRQAPYGRLHGR